MRLLLPALLCLSAPFLVACATNRAGPAGPETRTARAPDGVELVYEVRGAPSPTGGPALVFIHGWTCNREHWKEQVDVFDDTHRIVALDLGGHGDSGGAGGDQGARQTWTLPTLAGDVEAVIDAEGLERVVLIGHSMGGPVALLAAAKRPEQVVAVIGVDTLHDAEFVFSRDLVDNLAARMRADFDGFVDQFIRASFAANTEADPALIQWVIDGSKQTDPNVAAALMRAFADFDPKKAFAAYKGPIRCINAATPTTRVETNRKYNDNFDVTLIDHSGHFVMLERPEAFNAALREMLAELDQAAAAESAR